MYSRRHEYTAPPQLANGLASLALAHAAPGPDEAAGERHRVDVAEHVAPQRHEEPERSATFRAPRE